MIIIIIIVIYCYLKESLKIILIMPISLFSLIHIIIMSPDE